MEWEENSETYCSICPTAHILPGLCLLSLGYIGTDPYWHVAVITLSLGLNGAATLTNLQNSQDLAPNFAGSLYGIINFVGSTTGFITPLVVGHFTHDQVINAKPETNSQPIENYNPYHRLQNTIAEWTQLFAIGAVAYILPALVFLVFGSGNVQPWNEPKAKQMDDVAAAVGGGGGIATTATVSMPA